MARSSRKKTPRSKHKHKNNNGNNRLNDNTQNHENTNESSPQTPTASLPGAPVEKENKKKSNENQQRNIPSETTTSNQSTQEQEQEETEITNEEKLLENAEPGFLATIQEEDNTESKRPPKNNCITKTMEDENHAATEPESNVKSEKRTEEPSPSSTSIPPASLSAKSTDCDCDSSEDSASNTTIMMTLSTSGSSSGSSSSGPEDAFRQCLVRAEQGDAGAQNDLAVCYYRGQGTDRNLERAGHWWRRAAEQGCHPVAQYNLGVHYLRSDKKKQKQKRVQEQEQQEETTATQQAVHWFEQASLQGNAYATVRLAHCWERGYGVEHANPERAVALYTQAAQQGSTIAQRHLLRLVHALHPTNTNTEQEESNTSRQSNQENNESNTNKDMRAKENKNESKTLEAPTLLTRGRPCPVSETAVSDVSPPLQQKTPNGSASKSKNNQPQSQPQEPRILAPSQLVPFRDRDHAGEAKWLDIVQGMTDGELSETHTLIFHCDEWVNATDLIESAAAEEEEHIQNTAAHDPITSFTSRPITSFASVHTTSRQPETIHEGDNEDHTERSVPPTPSRVAAPIQQLPRLVSFSDGLSRKAALSDLEAWVKLALTLDGRDKITKVLQYTSRLLAWCLQGTNQAQRFEIMKKTLSNSRKAFRLGRTLIELQRFKTMGLAETLHRHWKRAANGDDNKPEEEDEEETETASSTANPQSERKLLRRISTNIGLNYWSDAEDVRSLIQKRQSSIFRRFSSMSSWIYCMSNNITGEEEKPLWHVGLAALKMLGLAVYFVGDNVSFLSSTGFCDNYAAEEKDRLTARKRLTTNATKYGNRAYFMAAVAGLAVSWRNYKDFCDRTNAHWKAQAEAEEGDATDVNKAKEKQFSLFLSLLKSCCDVLVFSNNPGIDLWKNALGFPMNEMVHCMAGLVSAGTVLCSNFPAPAAGNQKLRNG